MSIADCHRDPSHYVKNTQIAVVGGGTTTRQSGQMEPTRCQDRGTYREFLQNLTDVRVLEEFESFDFSPLLGPTSQSETYDSRLSRFMIPTSGTARSQSSWDHRT